MEAVMERRIFIAASFGAMAGCSLAPAERGKQLHTASTLAFGTSVSVAVVHAEPRVALAAMDEALAAARLVDQLMSIYRLDSQVQTLNRYGVLANPHPHLLAVLAQARTLSEQTRGAFDITVQPLWQAYADAAAPNGRPLPTDRIKAGALVNWERVQCDAQRIALRKSGMKITLNGLAQGYAADLALAALRARGIEHALVDMGEFASAGQRQDGLPWALGVEDPRDPQALAATMQLAGRCVATSGDYASWFTPDFVHHHIFDPATGESPQELSSVTVVAPTAMQADGLSTAFMVMGARKAHAMAARLPGVDLLTINKRGIRWKSPGFPMLA
jgi:thiamine biosynthesis lipoprotein